jgi:hypothetical protein
MMSMIRATMVAFLAAINKTILKRQKIVSSLKIGKIVSSLISSLLSSCFVPVS